MKGSGDHYITLPFNNNAIVNLIMGISSLGVEDIEEFYNSPDGRLSNYRGMELVVAYAISEKMNLVAKYYWIEQLDRIGLVRENGQRFRLDLNVRL